MDARRTQRVHRSALDYVPGTNMLVEGVKDPTQRADLIAFLRQNSSDPPPLPERP